ncbi:alkaline phosphatase family protein [Paenibacillus yanchengensis]|uniref:Alkaline phosphatase family protein n=1 Tax=Paenibacillus yanchengensis TaxID=2035833 RepID=A0ABW4YGU7_9BACL
MAALVKRVVVLGLDGMGNMNRQAKTPHMDQLLSKGYRTYEAQTVIPTISGECWGSMFHGVEPELHGLDNAVAEHEKFPLDSPYPSFLQLIRQTNPDAIIGSSCTWKPINDGIIEAGAVSFVANVFTDKKHIENVQQFLAEHDDFVALYIHFDEIDSAGHGFGYGTPLYTEVIEDTDKLVGQVVALLQEKVLYEDTLFIILADHGGGGEDPHGHGSAHSQDATIFWGCSGPGIREEAEGTALNIQDTAVVVAHALGLDIPAGWTAKLPEQIFL